MNCDSHRLEPTCNAPIEQVNQTMCHLYRHGDFVAIPIGIDYMVRRFKPRGSHHYSTEVVLRVTRTYGKSWWKEEC